MRESFPPLPAAIRPFVRRTVLVVLALCLAAISGLMQAQTVALVPPVATAASVPGTQLGTTGAVQIAGDAQGNLYVPTTTGVVRVTSQGGQTLMLAQSGVTAVAVDGSGNLWVGAGNTVLEYGPAGVSPLHSYLLAAGVTGLATGPGGAVAAIEGNGAFAYWNGTSFTQMPVVSMALGGIAFAPNGDLVIANRFGQTVLRFTQASGYTSSSVVAGFGAGTLNGNGDEGPAMAAKLTNPAGVAVDAAGNIYILDHNSNPSIRRVNASGIIETIAGKPATTGGVNAYGISVSNFLGQTNVGPASEAQLINTRSAAAPSQLVMDPLGRLLLGLNTGIILSVPTQGSFDAVTVGSTAPNRVGWYVQNVSVPSSTQNFVTLGSSASAVWATPGQFVAEQGASAQFGGPACIPGMGLESFTSITPKNQYCEMDFAFTPTTAGTQVGAGSVTTSSGSPATLTLPLSGSGMAGVAAARPMALAAVQPLATPAANSELIVARDPWGNLYLGQLGQGVFLVSGGGATLVPSTSAVFAANAGNSGNGLTFDAAGDMFFTASQFVYEAPVTSVTGNVPSFGTPVQIYTSLDSANTRSLQFDSAGDLYVGTTDAVEETSLVNGAWRTGTRIAGTGVAGFSGDGGAATTAQVNNVAGLAVDTAGNLYLGEANNNRVRRIQGGIISTVATAAGGVTGLAMDAGGTLYYDVWNADGSGTIFAVESPSAATPGTPILVGGAGTATATAFGQPRGIALDAAGNLYVANGASTVNAIAELATPNGTAVFGTVSVGTPATELVAVANMGTSGFTISGGSNAGDFTIGFSPATGATCFADSSTTVAPGTSCLALVTFTPAQAGTRSGSLAVNTSAGTLTIAATGVGHSTVGPPTSLAALLGTPQSTTVGAAFATALVAKVTDSNNNPVPGVSVTFSAPGSGASGSFAASATVTTDSNGLATAPVFTANTVTGGYAVTASIASPNLSASFLLTNNAGSPDSITLVSGGGQTTPVSTNFAEPLVYLVQDSFGNPVSNAVISVGFPSNAALASVVPWHLSITTGSNGEASTGTLTANDIAGQYTAAAVIGQHQALTSLNNAAGRLAKIVVALPALVQAGQQITATTAASDAFGNAVNPGNLAFTSSDAAAVLPAPSPAGGVVVTFNTAGTQSLTATSGAISGTASTVVLVRNVSFPAMPVGQSAPAQPVTIGFPSAATVGSIQVVTQGLTGYDFSNLGTGSCAAGAQGAGTTCTVQVGFTPKGVGRRLGAVVVYDNGGNILQTIFLSGIGQGALADYAGAVAVIHPAASAGGFTLDPQGNVYIPTNSNGLEVLQHGTFAVSTAGLTTPNPNDAVMDGAGNLYISLVLSQQVIRVPNVGGVLQYAHPQFISGSGQNMQLMAVDTAGNLFVSTGNGGLFKVTPNSTVPQPVNVALPGNSQGLVFGNDGNLYLTSYQTGKLYEVVAPESANPTLQTVMSPGGNPMGLGMDAAGDLYYNDSATGKVYRISNAGGSLNFASPTLVTTVSHGYKIAFDGAGTMYEILDNGGLAVTDLSAPVAQTYPLTNVGATSTTQSQSLTNIGNTDLTFGTVTYDPQFPNQSSTCGTGSLATGTSCNFSTAFAPAVGGAVSGSLSINDNANNETAAQVIAQSGTGNQQPQTITFANPGNSTYNGAPIALGATASSGLPISYNIGGASTGAGVVSSGQLTVTFPGSFIITASQAGNAQYAAAAAVTQTFTVGGAPLTLTGIAAQNKVFDGTAAAQLSIGTLALHGVFGTDQVGVTTPTSASFAQSTVGQLIPVTATPLTLTGAQAGLYTLQAAALAANISPATPTINWSPAAVSVLYANGDLSIGILDASSSTPGVISYTIATAPVSAGQTLPVGNYSIVATFTPTDTHDYNPGTATIGFAVLQAPITVTATSPAITFGQAVPAIAGWVTTGALVGADTLNSIGITCSAAGSPANAGNYVTSCSGSPSNYAVTFVNGQLTINPAASAVTFPTNSVTVSEGSALATIENATGSVPGTISYTWDGAPAPASTTAGSHFLVAALAPTSGNFLPSSATLSVVVPATFGPTPVGTPEAQPVTVSFPSAVTVGAIQVVTEGFTGLDFTNAGSGTCAAGAQAAGSTCTVSVTFTPTAVGQRLGAVVVYDTNNNVVQTIYLSGLGQGALAAYEGGTVASFPAPATIGLAIDAKGNVYVPNTNGDALSIYAPGAFSTPTSVPLPFASTFVSSLAFDGAGNLYISNPGGNPAGVERIPNINGALQYAKSTNFPLDSAMITADGAGNVFVLTVNPNQIYKIAPGAATAQLLGTTNIVNPQSMVFGNDGALYVTDVASNGAIFRIANPESANPITTVAGNVTGRPQAIGADPAGDLYYGDYSTGKIYSISHAGGSLNFSAPPTLVATVSGAPRQIAFDASGNMDIVSDPTGSTGQLTVINQVAPPAQSYPQTNVGATSAAQSQAITNIGNTDLTFGTITYDPSFPNQSSTCGTGSVAFGASCSFTTDFAPTVAGNPVTGTLSISDNAVNESAAQTVTQSGVAVQQTQTISFTLPSPVIYGVAPITLGASASSNLPVTFKVVSGPGTIAGGVLTATGAGSILVEADQAGNAEFLAASAQQTLVVNPAPLTVTADSFSRAFNAANPTFTGSVAGAANGDNFTETFATAATQASPVVAGGYAITPTAVPVGSASLNNYAVTVKPGTLTITQATPAISWTPSTLTAVYGTPITAGTLDATGSVPGTINYSIAVGTNLAVGTYTVTATFTPTDGNDYTGATRTITFTVTKATLVVTAANVSRFYNVPNPAFTGTVVGVTNGDNIAVTYSTGAGQSSNVGQYNIVPAVSGAALVNYNVTLNNGTLTITPAPQMITLAAIANQVFNGVPFAITLNPVASSGLPVSLSVTGPAALNGNVLTISAPGTVTVTATQGGSSNYQAAAAVQQSFKASLGLAFGFYATSPACNSFALKGNVKVDSFDSTLGAFPAGLAQSGGNVGTNGTLTLDGNAAIYGALFDPHGNTRDEDCDRARPASLVAHGRNTLLSGGIIGLPAALVYPTPAAPSPAPPSTRQRIDDQGCGLIAGCSSLGRRHLALAPGQYGSLEISDNITVDLSAGTYNLNSMRLGGGAVLNIASGPVTLNLAGLQADDDVLDAKSGGIRNPGAPSNLVILYGGLRDIELSGGRQGDDRDHCAGDHDHDDQTCAPSAGLAAIVYAPNASVKLSGGTVFSGTIVGRTINSDGDVTLHYDRSLATVAAIGGGTPPPSGTGQHHGDDWDGNDGRGNGSHR